MADYTPPAGDDVNFSFTGAYEVPDGDDVNFLFGLVATISMFDPSRYNMYDGDADTTILRWRSDIEGEYRVRIGGTDHTNGYLYDEGWVPAEYIMMHEFTVADLQAAAGVYTGPGSYNINVYVKSSDNIWSS
jgi:hypothetical protein